MQFKSELEQRNSLFLNSINAKIAGVPPPQPRLIDKIESRPRDVPMRVLCLGMSRTGTFSMFVALTQLGFKPYHMAAAMENAAVEFPLWEEALYAKFKGKGQPWTKEDFDKLLGRYDCVADVPCICFAHELIKFYPEAKVILTQRPVEGWLKSMRNTVAPVIAWPRWRFVAWADPDLCRPWNRFKDKCYTLLFGDLFDYTADDSKDPAKTHPNSSAGVYEKHYQHVKDICPKDRLLEFNIGDGWDKLCPFLGVEQPDGPYPRVNDGPAFTAFHAAIMNRATKWAVQKVLATIMPAAAVVGVAFYLRKSGWMRR